MGVLLTPIIVKQTLSLEDLRGRRLAVDANGELYLYTKSDGIIRAVVGATGF